MSGKYSIHPMEAMARGITPKPPLSDDACEHLHSFFLTDHSHLDPPQ